MTDNKIFDFKGYKEKQEKEIEKANEEYRQLKAAASRLFSTDDGKRLARTMIRHCHLLEAEQKTLPCEDLQRLQAQKDFVNTFITKLVDRSVFINIIQGL